MQLQLNLIQIWLSPHLLHCLCLHHKTLKRKEKEYEHEMERLAREKISTQQRLAELKNELSQCMDVMEIDRVLRQTIQPEDDQASTSTASGTRMRFSSLNGFCLRPTLKILNRF